LTDRASVIGVPEIAALVATRYVPVAIDQHVHRRLGNAEGRFFAAIRDRAGQLDGHAQGFYVFTVEGRVLAYRHTLEPEVVEHMLVSALEEADAHPPAPGALEIPEEGFFVPEPPAGGLVLDVVSKVLGGYDEPTSDRERILQSSLGRDHAWIRRDEAAALAEGRLTGTLVRRLARFHLVDNTRGEPPMWREDEVRELEANLADGRIAGSVHLETAPGDRGFQASLQGHVGINGGTVVGFDLLAHGAFWGQGDYTTGAPRGRFPLAIRFTLAPGSRPIDRVLPGGARRKFSDYLGHPQ
jgi:hypothetical protein